MDSKSAWLMFAKTGNILTYLDYREKGQPSAQTAPQEDSGYGSNRNVGACAPTDQV